MYNILQRMLLSHNQMFWLLILFNCLSGGECFGVQNQKKANSNGLFLKEIGVHISVPDVLKIHQIQPNVARTSLRVLLKDKGPFALKNAVGTYDGIEVRLVEQIAKELKLKTKYFYHNGSQIDENAYRLIFGFATFSLHFSCLQNYKSLN